jgi:hypothetical protein
LIGLTGQDDAAMVKYCSNCGAANTPDSRFCARCGQSLAAAVPSGEADAATASPQTFSAADDSAVIADGEARRPWLVPAVIALSIALIIGAYYWLFLADDRDMQAGTETGATASADDGGTVQRLYVMTEANVRDRATTVGSTILGKMPRGSAVSGVVKLGEDGKSEWLELADGKGFIATVNLGEVEPPEIARSLGDRIWTADSALDLWSEASTDSALLDRLSEGTKLTLAGLTANDFIEVKLPRGGVGYLAGGSDILARLGGKPVVIAFDPQSCAFGPELEAEFARIAVRLKAQWEALEARDYASEDERERAIGKIEGQSTYVRLARSFEGLSLTAIGQHYESQSLYFSDPPAKVIETFRRLGYRIGADGSFAATEIYAGISATRGEGTRYGKSELGCGV